MIKYIKLLDSFNKDMIIKADGIDQQRYIFGADLWIPTAIMLDYFSDESEFYELYEQISEQEAEALLKSQREKYLDMYKKTLNFAKNCSKKNLFLYNFVINNGGFKDIETDTAALLYSINHTAFEAYQYPERILYSVNILNKGGVLPERNALKEISLDENAQKIKRWEILHLYKKGQISDEDFKSIIYALQ